MKIAVAAASLVMLAFSASPAFADLKVTYDRFDKTTSVDTADEVGKLEAASGSPIVVLYYNHPENREWSNLGMYISRLGQKLRYKTCRDTKWLLDDQPTVLVEPEYRGGKVTDSSNFEHFNFKLDEKSFAKLAAANKIEVRMCKDELRFDGETLHDLRELQKRIKDPAYQPAPYVSPNSAAAAPRHYSMNALPPRNCSKPISGKTPLDAGPKPTDIESKVRAYMANLIPDAATATYRHDPARSKPENHCELGNVWMERVDVKSTTSSISDGFDTWLFYFRNHEIVGDMSIRVE